ncbi:MAG TPA: AmmeMemoRadiSam system protein A [Phycisphaerae bacterium]|nr:AmmeMemoRadiSam system protein A [Phycisphaerae bacterium]HUU22376.1 AmmeMemoRadiSam system protein A [Phycisphaerae bacterium]
MALTENERNTLLGLARESVAATVGKGRRPRPVVEGTLGERRGCFVTLTNRGRLRGCIGTFDPARPLGEEIVEMAAAAATDPRFIYYNPITAGEVDALTVGVSVLSELEPIDDPLAIELGVHGIYVVAGGASGCFLPEVATETGWTKEQFLSECCAGKAGMGPDAWRDGTAKVYVFTSEKFSDA